DLEILHRLEHELWLACEVEFRGMNPDHHQSELRVALMPLNDVRQRADTINAGVIPKIDQRHTFSTQRAKRYGAALEPLAAHRFRGEDCLLDFGHRSFLPHHDCRALSAWLRYHTSVMC